MPPGRPPNDDPGSNVSTWVSQSEHDQLIVLANNYRLSVSATVRIIIQQALAREAQWPSEPRQPAPRVIPPRAKR